MTTSSCVDPNTIINHSMESYMASILKINASNNEYKDQLFTGKTLSYVNSSIRNNNYYMLDKYGLPIRKNAQDSKKTAFGWKYDSSQDPVNIHIDDLLLATNSSEIQSLTLQRLKQSFPNLFKPPRGVIYKIYINEFPDVNLDTI